MIMIYDDDDDDDDDDGGDDGGDNQSVGVQTFVPPTFACPCVSYPRHL